VAAHRALEVRDGIVDCGDVVITGPTGRQPSRRGEQLLHHLVVTAMAAVELGETIELHAGTLDLNIGGRDHRRRRFFAPE
jgi:hypothetical protein